MNIGDIIKLQRKKLGLTLEQVGNAVGVSKTTVRKWEIGYIENLKRDKIENLAKVLHISPVTLITGNVENNSNIIPQKAKMIPVYESVSAGFGAYADNYIVDYMPLIMNCEEEAKNTICIKVSGDSMYPKIEDGDIIQVLKQPYVDNGRVGVFLIDGENAVVKKAVYSDKGDCIELHSFNPEYKTRKFEGNEIDRICVLGMVKKVIKDI